MNTVQSSVDDLNDQFQRTGEAQEETNIESRQNTINLQDQIINLQNEINSLDQMSYSYNEYSVYVTPENYDQAVSSGYIAPEQFNYNPGSDSNY